MSFPITHEGQQHLDKLFTEHEGGLGVRPCGKTEPHWQHEYDFPDEVFTRLAALCRGVEEPDSIQGVMARVEREFDVSEGPYYLNGKAVVYVHQATDSDSVYRLEVTQHR